MRKVGGGCAEGEGKLGGNWTGGVEKLGGRGVEGGGRFGSCWLGGVKPLDAGRGGMRGGGRGIAAECCETGGSCWLGGGKLPGGGGAGLERLLFGGCGAPPY